VRFCVIALALWLSACAFAAPAPARFDVALITIGPGPIYWQRFGHNAILIDDLQKRRSTLYSYGFFDFEQEDFFGRFLRGDMRYEMDGLPAELDLKRYFNEGRSIRLQRLNLTPEQAAALVEFLEWNRDPTRRHYRYDYYLANCSTKVRDVLDRVLDGALEKALVGRSRGLSWRMHTLRSVEDDAPLWLALHIGLGQRADAPLNLWQEAFLPERLSAALREVNVPVRDGLTPLVSDERELSPGDFVAPPDYPSDRLIWGLLFGLALVGLSLALSKWPLALKIWTGTWLLLNGITGTVVLALGTLTAHRMAWPNENLLVLTPLALLILFWPSRGPVRRWLWRALIVSSLTAIVIQWLPAFGQANGVILAFAVPLNVTLALLALAQPSGMPTRPET
jgi:Domain of unknown function (DUF4105)